MPSFDTERRKERIPRSIIFDESKIHSFILRMSHVCSAAISDLHAQGEHVSAVANRLTQDLLCKKIGFIMKRDLIYILETTDTTTVCIAYSKSDLEHKLDKHTSAHYATLHVTEIQNRPFVLEKLALCSRKDFERKVQIYMDSLFMHWLLNKAISLCMLVIVGALFYLAKIYSSYNF